MTNHNTDNIYFHHLSSEELLRYHRRLLSADETNVVSQHLQGCELCADALKGMAEMQNAIHIHDITHELKKRMKKRVSVKKKIFTGLDLLSIIMILFILGFIILVIFYFIFMKR